MIFVPSVAFSRSRYDKITEEKELGVQEKSMEQIKTLMLTILLATGLIISGTASSDDTEQLVLGDHVLTLQWLRNHNGIGKVKIYKKDGKIYVEGYQEEDYDGFTNYLSMQGEIRIINARELEFEGRIFTKINFLNSGKIYERNGKFILKAWGNRKYWRMQNMTQPDGPHTVTDYIDIYFEKFR